MYICMYAAPVQRNMCKSRMHENFLPIDKNTTQKDEKRWELWICAKIHIHPALHECWYKFISVCVCVCMYMYVYTVHVYVLVRFVAVVVVVVASYFQCFRMIVGGRGNNWLTWLMRRRIVVPAVLFWSSIGETHTDTHTHLHTYIRLFARLYVCVNVLRIWTKFTLFERRCKL